MNDICLLEIVKKGIIGVSSFTQAYDLGASRARVIIINVETTLKTGHSDNVQR